MKAPHQRHQVRIDKLICEKTTHSRREVHKLIRRGEVLLNGQRVLAFDHPVDRQQDLVSVSGKSLTLEQYVYLMLHKPPGVVCATEDNHLPTVMELVPESLGCRGLFPAGRLDRDTTGFVLITNHGELAHRLLSPKSHVPKVYKVTVDKPLDDKTVAAFRQGVALPPVTKREKSKMSSANANGTGQRQKPIVCKSTQLVICPEEPRQGVVTLQQGMFHQIKRMFAVCGFQVQALHRLSIGGVALDPTLLPGQCRSLTPREVSCLSATLSNLP